MLKHQQSIGKPEIHILIRATPHQRGVKKNELVHTRRLSCNPSVEDLQITVFACTNKKQAKRTTEMSREVCMEPESCRPQGHVVTARRCTHLGQSYGLLSGEAYSGVARFGYRLESAPLGGGPQAIQEAAKSYC